MKMAIPYILTMNSQPLFNRLLPILFVKDLASEVKFYQNFGFEISYQGEEFPGFMGLRSGAIEFGLEQKDSFDSQKAQESFIWQMDTTSFRRVREICQEHGIAYSEPRQYWARMDGWEMTVKTPNGYILQLEKIGKD